MAKFVVMSGSPRKNGTTAKIMNMLVDKLKEAGSEIKMYDLNQPGTKGCQGCGACRARPDCVQKDQLQTLYQDVRESAGIIFVSPIYMTGVTGQAKVGLDRMYPFIDINLQPRVPGKKAVCIITMGDKDEEQFYNGIGQVTDCFEKFGWDQIEPIICAGTASFGFEIPQNIVDQVEDSARQLLE